MLVLAGSFPVMLPLCNPVKPPLAVSCFYILKVKVRKGPHNCDRRLLAGKCILPCLCIDHVVLFMEHKIRVVQFQILFLCFDNDALKKRQTILSSVTLHLTYHHRRRQNVQTYSYSFGS